MKRLFSWLVVTAFVLGVLGVASYAAANYRTRQLLGPNSPVRGPTTTFAYNGVQDVRGKPRAWVFTYRQVRLPGVQRVRIVVSPFSRILSITPSDLETRLDAYNRSLEP